MILSSIALYALVRSHLLNEIDWSLLEQARQIASLTEYHHNKLDLELEHLPEDNLSRSHTYLMVWDRNGQILARSASLGEQVLPRFGVESRHPVLQTGELLGDLSGRDVRMAALSFIPHPEDESDGLQTHPIAVEAIAAIAPVTLVVARDLRPFHAMLTYLLELLAAIWAAAMLASILVLWWVIRRGLAPATALSQKISTIVPPAPSVPINLPNMPRELAPVVQRLNDLLTRIDAAFVREKTFLAAAAHELRTPLSGLRTTLEVTLSRPRPAQAYYQPLRQCLDITQQMQSMIDNLLCLARIDAGQTAGKFEPIDLIALLADCWQPLVARANERGLDVDWQISPPAHYALADRQKLRMVLQNILDNAVSYAEPGSTIQVTSQQASNWVELQFTNPAGGLSPQDISHVFERFWRGDTSRHSNQNHLGLGLALCHGLTKQMAGRIRAAGGEGRFILILSLPRPNRLNTERAIN